MELHKHLPRWESLNLTERSQTFGKVGERAGLCYIAKLVYGKHPLFCTTDIRGIESPCGNFENPKLFNIQKLVPRWESLNLTERFPRSGNVGERAIFCKIAKLIYGKHLLFCTTNIRGIESPCGNFENPKLFNIQKYVLEEWGAFLFWFYKQWGWHAASWTRVKRGGRNTDTHHCVCLFCLLFSDSNEKWVFCLRYYFLILMRNGYVFIVICTSAFKSSLFFILNLF